MPRILSRMRSPMTSRLNCAKDNKTFNIRRPIEVVVLNCCVAETKERTPPLASRIYDLGKIGERAGQPIDLGDDQGVDSSRGDIVEQLLQRRPIDRRDGEPDVITPRGRHTQPSCRWLVMKASQASRCACSELNC
jgi:hypothetical protein